MIYVPTFRFYNPLLHEAIRPKKEADNFTSLRDDLQLTVLCCCGLCYVFARNVQLEEMKKRASRRRFYILKNVFVVKVGNGRRVIKKNGAYVQLTGKSGKKRVGF